MVRQRHPVVAETMIWHLEQGAAPCFQAVRESRELVGEAGLTVPSWTELSLTRPQLEEEPDPNQPKHGWQQKATRELETKFSRDVVARIE